MANDWVKVKAGGKSATVDGEYDCAHQKNVIGISFANDGNQRVMIEFGGAKRILVQGTEFTHFTNYPYVNATNYVYSFVDTPVAGAKTKQLNIYVLKTC